MHVGAIKCPLNSIPICIFSYRHSVVLEWGNQGGTSTHLIDESHNETRDILPMIFLLNINNMMKLFSIKLLNDEDLGNAVKYVDLREHDRQLDGKIMESFKEHTYIYWDILS